MGNTLRGKREKLWEKAGASQDGDILAWLEVVGRIFLEIGSWYIENT